MEKLKDLPSQVYASFSKAHPDVSRVVGVADPRPMRANTVATMFSLPKSRVVSDWRDFAQCEKFADAVVICLLVSGDCRPARAFSSPLAQDHDHLVAVQAFAALGYHILCEKCVAPTLLRILSLTKSPDRWQ